MKRIFTMCVGLLLTACVSTPTVDSMVADGAQVITGGIGSLVGEDGVTLTAVDNTWIAYLAPDGKKEISIKPLSVRDTLAWRRRDDGTFCEQMYNQSEEKCDDQVVLVKRANGVYSTFTDGKLDKYPFTAASGNTSNF